MQRCLREIGSQVGFGADTPQLLTGSVGALEATVQSEHLLKDLGELNRAWDKLATIAARKQWSKDLEPHVVSGTSRWEIFRVL